MVFWIKATIIIIAGLIASYTDFKTGYIHDWLTYPLILLGFIFMFISGEFYYSLLVFAIVFALGYLFYRTGKLGGGDVKLLAGIALFFPMYEGFPFVLLVMFFASLSAMLIYGTKYFIYLVKTKPQNLMRNSILAALFSLLISVFFWKQLSVAIGIFYVLFVGSMSYIYREIIQENMYSSRVKIKDLLDDDLVSLGVDRSVIIPLDAKLLQKIRIERDANDEVIVYRKLPIFAPYILIGIIASLFLSKYISVIFLL